MGDVTGPIRTLPGSLHKLPEGAVCDDHPDRPAVRRVQGETDSLGAELLDVCQECYNELIDMSLSIGPCDWCGATAELKPRRDFEEGSTGRVYDVCQNCIDKQNKMIDEELGHSEDFIEGDYYYHEDEEYFEEDGEA